MRLIASMIAGPGEADRHLGRCLAATREWADLVVVYGDAPDPATVSLISEHADVWQVGGENLYEQGEHLVRNKVLAMLDETVVEGDIVVVLDADEQIHADAPAIRRTLAALECDTAESWNVRFLHVWNEDGTLHRVDGLWQPSVGPRIYRHHPGYRLRPLYESAWVCPPLPPHLLRTGGRPAVLDVLHWSYARERDRQPKFERYSRLPGHSPAHIRSIIETPTLEPVPCR